MWLERIRLKNWKCFVDVTFSFPRPTEKKSVVLIGALNGSGKTSLLEAVLCCLYGPKVMPLLPYRPEERVDYFASFISKRVNRVAVKNGNTRSRIELVFNNQEERWTIERSFYVYPSGVYKEQELHIYEGKVRDDIDDKKPVALSAIDGNTRDEQLENFVSQMLLPLSLARFFFFDGERIQDMAHGKRSDIVGDGLEELMGVKLLRTLQEDLKLLKDKIRGRCNDAETNAAQFNRLKKEVQDFEKETKELDSILKNIETAIKQNQEKQRDIQEAYGFNISGSQDIDEINRKFNEAEAARNDAEKQLGAQISSIALAMPGRYLTLLFNNLKNDELLDQWQRGLGTFSDQFRRLVEIFEHIDNPVIDPPLTEGQSSTIKVRLEKAQELVHHPPPENLPKEIKHKSFSEQERRDCIERIKKVRSLSKEVIIDLVNKYEIARQDMQNLQRKRAELAEGSRAREQMEELRRLAEEYGALKADKENKSRALETIKTDLQQKRAELGRLEGHSSGLASERKKQDVSEKIIDLLDGFIVDLKARKGEELGERMSQSYKKLARKGDKVVKKILVDESGAVQLIGAGGDSLSERQDFSAGEDEIFALSFLQAAAQIPAVRRPMIIDTPLARFDSKHRANVVEHFMTKASNQVIVLSTDQEVVEDLYEMIEPSVSKKYLLEFDEDKQETVLHEDEYFGKRGGK